LKGKRLDERVVEDGLADSRTRAQALIRAGRVLVDDTPMDKPGTRIRDEAQVRVRGDDSPFVSRGGEKLASALADLGIQPKDKVCLDVGASTGGFTDCLLQHGAARVVAVDVGYGQIHDKLRRDARVEVHERVNARELDPALVPDDVGLVTMDVSFISARLILPRLVQVAPGAELLILVKPQFEVGKEQVGKGGVVRDDATRQLAVAQVRECAEGLGLLTRGQADSRVHGPKGNREIFLHFAPSPASIAAAPGLQDPA
jgi:23S rRNA (cytidine1920-2'-O)/16S rRNA (cytidine1409-2'-O)-methyltransferase